MEPMTRVVAPVRPRPFTKPDLVSVTAAGSVSAIHCVRFVNGSIVARVGGI